MTTLAQKCKEAGLVSAAELTRLTNTSKETLTNWMKDKPVLFEIVLKGAIATLELKIEQKQPEQPPKKQPEQTWCFSQADLQEQARLIEKLTRENQELTAELQLTKKSKDQTQTQDNFKTANVEKFNLILTERNEKIREIQECETENELNDTINDMINNVLTNRERDNYEQKINKLTTENTGLKTKNLSAAFDEKKWDLQCTVAQLNKANSKLKEELNGVKKDLKGQKEYSQELFNQTEQQKYEIWELNKKIINSKQAKQD